jgi:hypothetical protein
MNIINATPAAVVVTPPTTSTGKVGNAKIAMTPFIRSSDAALVTAINRIIDMMTGNEAFTTPLPTLAAVTTAQNAYAQAVNTLDRGQPAQIRRNDARAAVVQLVRELALYVQQTSQGNLGVLVSSGFTAQKGRGPRAGVLPAPVNLRLSQGKLSGQLQARCQVVPAARAYQWRYATVAAPTVWTLSDPTTSSRFLVEGLTAGTGYLVQARAIGAQGAGNWSGSATSMPM